MSYIRSTSNPENLYVWGDVRGRLNFWWALPDAEKKLCRGNDFAVATWKVRLAAYRFDQTWDRPVSVGGFSLREIYVFTDTGKPVPARFDIFRSRRDTRFVIRVSYDKAFVCLYRTTWSYVARRLIEEHERLLARRKRKGKRWRTTS